MRKKIIYISGGCRSGKSSLALSMVRNCRKKVFLATAEALDQEMRERISMHRKDRDDSFITIEEPVDPARKVLGLPSDIQAVVIDCLTVWAGNLMHYNPEGKDEDFPQIDKLFSALKSPPCRIILVSNELGMGLVPHDALSRRYRDLMGKINQQAAALADEAYFVVSGLSIRLK